MVPRPTIAIIGGGFSGSLVATHLLRLARQPLRIVLFDRADAPGRGVAYRDQPECHLLNVRVEGMSAFPNQPDHFLDWLNGIYSPCHPVGSSEFLPRRIYGAYVQSVLAQSIAGARRGVVFETRCDEVLELRDNADGFQLRTRGKSRLLVDQAVLAFGNPGPADPPSADAHFYKSSRYIGQAWSTPGLYLAKPDEDLLLIGSGLTTLDWLVALRDRDHRGRIHVVSRRGLLPQLHKAVAAHKLSFDALAIAPRVAVLLKRMRREIAEVTAAGGDWRSVIDGLRPYTQAIWSRLPLAEQRRFLRHVRPYWEVHRHRASPKIIDTVDDLLKSGQLRLTAARLLGFDELGDRVKVSIRPRRPGGPENISVQRVINCTGPESNYRRLSHPLIVNLREQGLIQPDALGLGLATNEHGALIATDERASQRLHTLGPPRKGQLWETTAVPEIRVQAQALARRLLARMEVGCEAPPTKAPMWV